MPDRIAPWRGIEQLQSVTAAQRAGLEHLETSPPQSIGELLRRLDDLRLDPEIVAARLPDWISWLKGLHITTFEPSSARDGDLITVTGGGFAPERTDNSLTVGGVDAVIIEASERRLVAVLGDGTPSGPVEVWVDGDTATATAPFTALSAPGPGEDGPPVAFFGAGDGAGGDGAMQVRSGPGPGGRAEPRTLRVLGVLMHATDAVPPDLVAPFPTTMRDAVRTAFGQVHRYYDQASFGLTQLNNTVTDWMPLAGSTTDYLDVPAGKIHKNKLDGLIIEAVFGAWNAGHPVGDFDVIAVVVNFNVTGFRGIGGWSKSSFKWGSTTLTTKRPLSLLVVDTATDWGRLAHEIAHTIVDAPPVSGERTANDNAVHGADVYHSDLVVPALANAEEFDLLGAHNSHPLFSSMILERLGWYGLGGFAVAGDIREVKWDRNPYLDRVELVAHGLARNAVAGRFHSLKITISNGLAYYVEVRQKPGGATSAQVFDDHIPGTSAPLEGGVIVTRALTATNQDNQQTRVLTLMHPVGVLGTGAVVEDPARGIRITVEKVDVVTRPLVARIRVEWAQHIADDPAGTFDLSITPADTTARTPDIWVDRPPFNTFDRPLDAAGRPLDNGDKPKPKIANRIVARVTNTGATDATDVNVTFYAVTPPGVGNNGNWSQIAPAKTVARIAANDHADVVEPDWVPLVGAHTCLKVFVSTQLGETSIGNNEAQENVFDFEAPAFSPPQAARIPVAVRNPRSTPGVVRIGIDGVPDGYFVQFPHEWVHLPPLGERELELLVMPVADVEAYVGLEGRELPAVAPVIVRGYLQRDYEEPQPDGSPTSSRFTYIGGILARVTPKRGVRGMEIWEADESVDRDAVIAAVVPRADSRDHAEVTLTDLATGEAITIVERCDDRGLLTARFDLGALAEAGGRRPGDIGGQYEAVVEVFDSATVTDVLSQPLTIVR
ncbi:MAG: IPT/TIG domain-containing protein [Agromyces sp.]